MLFLIYLIYSRSIYHVSYNILRLKYYTYRFIETSENVHIPRNTLKYMQTFIFFSFIQKLAVSRSIYAYKT